MIEVGQIINGWKVTHMNTYIPFFTLEKDSLRMDVDSCPNKWTVSITTNDYVISHRGPLRAGRFHEALDKATQWANEVIKQ